MRTDKKIEIGLVFGFLVLAFGIGSFLTQIETKMGFDHFTQNYIMPRPKSLFSSLFSLEQREIFRRHINPFESKQKNGAEKAKETQKAQTSADQGKKAQKKVAQKPKKDKEKSLEVEVISDNNSDLANSNQLSGETYPANTLIAAERSPQSPLAEELTNDPQAESPKTDEGQEWRARLLSEPTEENMNALLGAYSEEKVSSRAFYLIIFDLVSFNKVETAEVALIGLQATPSLLTLNSLVRFERYFQTLSAEKYQLVLKDYTQPNRVSILTAAMQSRDARLVKRAIEISMVAYSQRDVGGQGSAQEFAQARPVLQQLAISSNSEVADLATAALSQFQLVAANKNWTN